MTCGLCQRPVSRKDVEAKRYTRSVWTGSHYCIRTDCRSVYARLQKAAERLVREHGDTLREMAAE